MRAALRAERRIGGIQHVIDAVEIEPADQPDAAAAQRGVAVEILEAIEQRLAEARQHVAVVLAGGAAAEGGPAGFDALVEERDHGAEMMRHHLQLRKLGHHSREDQAGHGGAGFVRPSEDRPDLVLGKLLGRKIRNIGLARRMQQDRLAGFGGHFEDRPKPRLVEAGAVHVGVELQAVGVAVDQDALGLLDRGVGVVHRQRPDIAREPIRILCHQLGQAVVGGAGKLRRLVGTDHAFERRQPERKDLRVVVERVHHAKARVEIVNGANALHALADVGRAARGLRHQPEYALRKEMAEGIDVPHGGLTPVVSDGLRGRRTRPIRTTRRIA